MFIFSENLKRICKLNNTNPTNLCKSLGLSTSKVNAWNNGSIPKIEILEKLAYALHCDISNFFESKIDEQEIQLLINFRKMDDSKKESLLRISADL